MTAIRLRVTDDGPATAPPLLLLSSVGTAAPLWEPVMPHLLGAGLRVVRLDARGHGGSPPSPTRPGELRLDDLVDDVEAALDEAGLGIVHVAGASLGGMVAVGLAVRDPLRVRSLALICTSAHPGRPQAWAERAAQVRAGGMAAVAESVVGRWLTPDWTDAHPQVVADHVAQLCATDPETYAQICMDVLAPLDLRPVLGGVRAPTLVVAGDHDPQFDLAHARGLVDTIPGSRLEVLSPAAHLPVAEHPAELGRLLHDHLERHH